VILLFLAAVTPITLATADAVRNVQQDRLLAAAHARRLAACRSSGTASSRRLLPEVIYRHPSRGRIRVYDDGRS